MSLFKGRGGWSLRTCLRRFAALEAAIRLRFGLALVARRGDGTDANSRVARSEINFVLVFLLSPTHGVPFCLIGRSDGAWPLP